jgi:tRNA/rRNA methyltransferase
VTTAALAQVRIVLVEPAGPLNVGSVARVMKNMGLSQLVLVNPQCDLLDDQARLMAVHAADILTQAQVVSSLPEALVGCYRAIATSGLTPPLMSSESPRVALPWLLEKPSALIFGREDRGLTSQELGYSQRQVMISSDPVYASLNLAQAVGICCHELRQAALGVQDSIPMGPQAPVQEAAEATLAELEPYLQHLETLLLQIGYLHPHTAASRMQKFRGIYQRSQLSQAEVALLRGILRQTEWALQCAHSARGQ